MCLCFIFMVYTVVLSAKSGIADKVNKAEGTQKTVVKSSTEPKKSSVSKPQKSSTQKKSSAKAQETFDYIVQEGDTLSGIAAVHGLSSDEVLKLNPGLDPSLISVGMVIKLPKSVEGKSSVAESAANSDQTTTDSPTGLVSSGQGDDYYSYPPTSELPTPTPETPRPETPAPETPAPSPEPEVPTPEPETPTPEPESPESGTSAPENDLG